MTHLPAYQFEGYLFRPAVWGDLALAQSWNHIDPEHTWEGGLPLYWIEQTAEVNSYVLEDRTGVVFFVKSIRSAGDEIQINLQFDRSHATVSKMRTMQGMVAGMRWLQKALPLNGFRAVYFVSKNPELMAFAEKGLGFARDGERYVFVFTKGDADGQVDSSKTRQVA